MTPDTFISLLNDPVRLRCLQLFCRHGELCLCELSVALDTEQSTLNRPLTTLHKAGLLSERQAEGWVYYRLHPHMPVWQLQTLELSLNYVDEGFQHVQARLLTIHNRIGKACTS